MKSFIISDLHLTDDPKEDYRWAVFPWALEQIKQRQCTDLFILGDFLHKKDRHPATLVNRLVTELITISQHVPIKLLKGNHDYLDPNSPFLQFVQHIPNIQWINDPTFISLTLAFDTLWLPHSRNPMKDWESILTKKSVQLVFMHQSVIGARTSSDFEINNALDLAWLEAKVRCPIISGDIHVPQQIRSLTYVGTQHPVAYGDDYEYRALLLEVGKPLKLISIPHAGMKRHSLTITTVEELKDLLTANQLHAKDQVKLKIQLSEDNLSQWQEIKNEVRIWCDQNEIHIADCKLEKTDSQMTTTPDMKTTFKSLNPKAALERFLENGLDAKFANLGRQILSEVENA